MAPIGRAATPAPRDAKLPPPELRFETFEDGGRFGGLQRQRQGRGPARRAVSAAAWPVPIGLRRDEIAFVEVIINEDGRVMQVKARESPATLDESMVLTMSLSAAKTWRFQAARKDGNAVKYRQVLPVSLR